MWREMSESDINLKGDPRWFTSNLNISISYLKNIKLYRICLKFCPIENSFVGNKISAQDSWIKFTHKYLMKPLTEQCISLKLKVEEVRIFKQYNLKHTANITYE